MASLAIPGLALLTVLVLNLAGCFAGSPGTAGPLTGDSHPDFSHLGASGAASFDGAETRSFTWRSATNPSVKPGVAELIGQPTFRFPANAAVGFAEVRVNHSDASEVLMIVVYDDQGRKACAILVAAPGANCTAAIPRETAGLAEYRVDVSYDPADLLVRTHPRSVPFELNVTLHPPTHLRFGHPLGTDALGFSFFNSYTGRRGFEPTLGATKDGNIFAMQFTQTLRSRDEGKTWEDVTPAISRAAATTLDPMLYVDPWTSRVFSNHLYVACSHLSWSDDEGASWTTNPAACGTPLNDHQKLGVGGHFLANPLFNGIVYYSYMAISDLFLGETSGGVWASRSLDGGATWTSALAVHGTQGYEYLENGVITADRNGNVYIPLYLAPRPPERGGFADGEFAVTVSNDFGVTWTPRTIGKGTRLEDVDAGIGIDSAHHPYLSFLDGRGAHFTYSLDQGRTWAEPSLVTPPDLKSFVLGDMVAGDPGHAALVYVATPDTDRGPHQADGWARWHVYVTYSSDALAANPTWTTVRVTPDENPIQIGIICMYYVICPGGGDRNLGDFLDVQVLPDGRIIIAYVDGCLEACETSQESKAGQGVVAIQTDGPRLFIERAPWATAAR